MSNIEINKKLVSSFFEVLNAGDIDGLLNTYADNGSCQTMGETLISGVMNKEQIAATAGSIFDVFPDGLKFNVVDMIAEGDRVAVEAVSQGEHISGQTYSNEYHFLFEFRDGKLFRLKEYMDTEHVTDVLCGGQRPPFGA